MHGPCPRGWGERLIRARSSRERHASPARLGRVAGVGTTERAAKSAHNEDPVCPQFNRGRRGLQLEGSIRAYSSSKSFSSKPSIHVAANVTANVMAMPMIAMTKLLLPVGSMNWGSESSETVTSS